MFRLFLERFSLLTYSQKLKYSCFLVFGMALGFVELLGVLMSTLIGMVLSSQLIDSKLPSEILKILDLLKADTTNSYSGLFKLSTITLALFVFKSCLSLFVSRRLFRFLTTLEKSEMETISGKIFQGRFDQLNKYTKQELADTLSRGLSASFTNLLGQWQVVFSEFFLVALIMFGFLVIDPSFSLVVCSYFAIVFFFINRILHSKVDLINRDLTATRVRLNEAISNSIDLFRDIKVYRGLEFTIKRIVKLADHYSIKYSQDMWMQMIPKYVLELALLGGIFVILGIGSFSPDPRSFFTILLAFMVAGSRLLPSILRIQSAFYTLKGHSHLATKFFEINREFHQTGPLLNSTYSLDIPDFNEKMELEIINYSQVFYAHRGSNFQVFFDFSIPLGKKVAIVGPSGAGKSTLADLLLGIVEPDSGSISIAGIPIKSWLAVHEKRVSYVSQETVLVDGDIFDNVAFGQARELIQVDLVLELLERLNLSELISRENVMREPGMGQLALSGGEKQRIGIARAMYNSPELIVMDESTSSLDADSEVLVLKVLDQLDSDVTLLVIAHRLSSIRNFDLLIYVEDGRIIGSGDFESLRKDIKEFDNQARLLGL